MGTSAEPYEAGAVTAWRRIQNLADDLDLSDEDRTILELMWCVHFGKADIYQLSEVELMAIAVTGERVIQQASGYPASKI